MSAEQPPPQPLSAFRWPFKWTRRVNSRRLWLGWLILLALTLLWRLQNIDAFGLTNDEGAYLMWARLVSEGYSLYSQTRAGSPPLFIETLALVFRLAGFGVVTGRLVVLASFALLATALALLAHRIAGWPGAFVSLALAALLPPLFTLSRQVMLEVPAMLPAVGAVGCGYMAFGGGARPGRSWAGWPVLAGALLGASLLVKLLHPLAALPVLYFLWRGAASRREVIRRNLWFGLALAGTLLAVFLFFDRPALLDQVVRFRSQTRSDLLLPRPTNWRSFLVYAGQLWGLALPALAGLVVSVRSTRGQAWGLWLLANFALLMWYNPVFPHHFSLLLAPAILLAVEFVRFTIYELRITDETFPLAVKRVAWGVSGVIVVAALANLPAWVSANRATAAIVTGGREAEAARMLARVTRPADFVMSDSLLLALYAGRRTPPPLADISLVYIQTGRQTPEGLVAMSGIYSVTAVAPWALRMVWLPEYLDWAEQNFWVKKVWDNDHILFFGPKHPADRPIPNAQKTPFAGGVILSGYSLDAGPVAPGDSLPLTLYWQTAAPLQTDYTVFVHLLSGEGKLVAQHDGGPIYGYLPTTQWPVGEIIPDRLEIPLPADLPAGEYTLIAGMYNPHTLERLNRPDAAQDFAPLTTVAIR